MSLLPVHGIEGINVCSVQRQLCTPFSVVFAISLFITMMFLLCSWLMHLYFIFFYVFQIYPFILKRDFGEAHFRFCCLHFCIGPTHTSIVFSHHGFNLSLRLIHVPVSLMFFKDKICFINNLHLPMKVQYLMKVNQNHPFF